MFNNLVYSGLTCARIGSKAAGNRPSDIAEAGGNRFVGCRDAYNLESITLKIVKKDTFQSVQKEHVLNAGSKIR